MSSKQISMYGSVRATTINWGIHKSSDFHDVNVDLQYNSLCLSELHYLCKSLGKLKVECHTGYTYTHTKFTTYIK